MSKRTIMRSFAMLFVVLGLAAYALYLLTGRLPQLPPRAGAGGAANGSANLGTLAPMKTRDEGGYQVMQSGGTTVYKWRDADGRWHYGSRAPAQARQLQTLAIEPSPVTAAANVEPLQAAAEPSAAGFEKAVPASPYSADGIKQLLERAEDVNRLMQQRNSQLEQVE